MTLEELKQLFPKSNKSNAVIGKMPMDFYVANEKAIKAIMKNERLRTYYRGKRTTSYDTHKADATGVVFYSNIYG
jgi:hypothetical protein